MVAKILSLLLILPIIVGCDKIGSAGAVNISKLESPKIVKGDLYNRVNKYNADAMAKGVVSDQCYRRSIVAKAYSGNFCLKIVDVQKINDKVYVALSGDRYDDDWNPENSHVDQGVMMLSVLSDIKGELDFIVGSKIFPFGVYGSGDPSGIKLVQLNNAGDMGWVISSGDIHGGYVNSGISIYAAQGESIVEVASIGTALENSGACGDKESDCPLTTIDADVSLIKASGDGFYPIVVNVHGVEDALKTKKQISEKFEVKYSKKEQKYIIPPKLNELMSF